MVDLQRMFEDMIERNAYRIAVGDTMCEETGLMMCGKCGTPRECKIVSPFDGRERIVGCLCKCQADQMRKEGTIK